MSRSLGIFAVVAAASFGLVACGSPADATADAEGAESVVGASSSTDAPSNFAQVRDGLYRGGHPSYDNLAYLKSLGVTTVVDLEIADYIEATPEQIQQELDDAALLGLEVVREPMSAFEPFVNHQEMDATLAILASNAPARGGDDAGDAGASDEDAGDDGGADAAPDAGTAGGRDGGSDAGPKAGAIYVHCRHGQDRTGLVIGLERVLVEGWDQADAYAEMRAHGFHTYFLGLKHYFFAHT